MKRLYATNANGRTRSPGRNTCPDFIEDKGHYYGHQLGKEDKQALIEYMNYF